MLYNKRYSKLIRTEQLFVFQLEIQSAEKRPHQSLWNTPATPVIKITPRSWRTSCQWVTQSWCVRVSLWTDAQSHTRESRAHKPSQLTEPREMNNAKMTWNHSNVQVACKGKMWKRLTLIKQWQMMHWIFQSLERFSGSTERQPIKDSYCTDISREDVMSSDWLYFILKE